MASFIRGIRYNFKGLAFGLKTPSLLLLGMVRMVVILALTIAAVSLVISRYQDLANLMWTRPASAWLVWLWYAMSWLLALLLSGISAVVAFLIAQVLFSVLIMDYMSRITERRATGKEIASPDMPRLTYFFYLLKQEIPRATLPICISLAAMLAGWLTPWALC
jgi:CysZ protein